MKISKLTGDEGALTLLIQNATIYAENTILQNGYILIENSRISEIGPMENCPLHADKILTLQEGQLVLPGFIDIHIHGAGGADAMDGKEEALRIMVEELPKEGTTSFLATTMTQDPATITKALQTIKSFRKNGNLAGESELLGIHLEGPFISPSKAGAQPIDHIIAPQLDLFTEWNEASGNAIKLVTLAPEQPGAKEVIEYLRNSNILCSIGHTNASYQQATEAIKLGASHATHLFNQMTGLHHRDVGAAGAALLNDQVYMEIIADGIHVSPEMIKLALRVKGVDKTILITDAMRAKGMAEGRYELGGQEVIVKGKEARLNDGTLAGSILKMNDAIKKVCQFTDCTLQQAIQMASVNPAKQLNIFERKGSIAIGKDADLVIMNSNLDVFTTICRGIIAYRGEQH